MDIRSDCAGGGSVKLGLIAVSGVRAYNPELTKLGLTLPGFVDRNRIIASLPSRGLLTLAGLTPNDVELQYIEMPGDVEGELAGGLDAVAISSFTARIKDAYRLADRYRARGTKVILGGLHVTALPEEAMQHADSIVIGEGEPLWPALIADLKTGAPEPVYDARGHSFDLADAPMPRFELLDIGQYNRLTVQTQRGCPFRCEFCASSILLSPKYKLKPVDKVIAEIRRIKELWPQPFIEFADDNSFVNKPHSKALMRELAKENVRWFTETDISVAEDDELLALMQRLCTGAGRSGKHASGRPQWAGAVHELESKTAGSLSPGHPAHSGPWHHGERMLCPGTRWNRSGELRTGLAIR